MKNFLIRSASAIVYAGILVVGSYFWSPLLYAALAFFMGFGLIELKRILKPEMNQGVFVFWTIFCLIIFALIICVVEGWLFPLADHLTTLLFAPILLIFPSFVISLLSNKAASGQLAFFTFSIIYIFIPTLIIIGLQNVEFNGNISWLLFLLTIIWINDSMAYITGSLIGEHKLIERVSPGKTWEGFFGGLFFSLAVVLIANYLIFDFDIDFLTVITIVAVLSGTIGDLLESKLKREAGLKDSGNIIPGHGGILDRIDSLLVAAPFTGLTLFLFNNLLSWF